VSQQRWDRLEQLFAEAITQPAPVRSAFLQRSCGDDTELRRDLDELLRAHDAEGVLDMALFSPDRVAPRASLAAGTCLGPWRIDTLIGRGGMGEVYAATRVDAAFEQRAALKLLRHDAVSQLDRFHAERRILARLEHPGIARLLDGGLSADGRPYTVMEYVAGRSLTEYCRAEAATLNARLALFIQVCDAVAFAHRNLIIHRDLKPDNILVDAQGQVKLLDFGIAKLLDAAASPRETHTTMAPFTPDYAAPEQLSGEPVTTATDIYALGVLLFELLTGERPLRTRGLPSTQAMHMLLDRTAPAPSRIAQAKADAPFSARLLQGDLDAIVAKCLRKEPAHRYEAVNALKRDIECHLRSEPVQAREGARLYVVGRLLRRYRWAIAGVGALIITLAAGLAGTIWQARRAETQARTAAAVEEFLSDMFRANASTQEDPVKARQTTARELLDIGAKKIDTGMMDAPAAKLSVLKLLGELYADLALDDEAVRLHREAVKLAKSLHGAQSIEAAAAMVNLTGAMHASNAVNEREQVLVEATAILDQLKDYTSDTRAALLRMQAEHYQSLDAPRALDYARQSVALYETKEPSRDFAESLYLRGLNEEFSGLVREAAGSYARAIEVSRAVDGYPNPSLPRFYAFLGQVQYRIQDVAGAERSARLALETAKAINGEDHVDTLQTEMRLGRFLFDTGRTAEGLTLLAAAKARALRIRGADDPFHTPVTQLEHGYALARMGLLEQGLADMQAAIANRRANRPGTIFLSTMLENAAWALIELCRWEQARAYLDEATAIKIDSGLAQRTVPHNFNTSTRIRLALAQGQVETARALIDEFVVDPDETLGISFTAVEQRLLTAETDLAAGDSDAAIGHAQHVRNKIETSGLAAYLPLQSFRADLVEGRAALQANRPALALPLLQRALDAGGKRLAASSPRIAEVEIALAECHLALGNVEQARSLAEAAASIQASHEDIGEHYRRPLLRLQALLKTASEK
jgi:eukaryotic-like serine/threonine-protein kinase